MAWLKMHRGGPKLFDDNRDLKFILQSRRDQKSGIHATDGKQAIVAIAQFDLGKSQTQAASRSLPVRKSAGSGRGRPPRRHRYLPSKRGISFKNSVFLVAGG
jgi:hypothetical protein